MSVFRPNQNSINQDIGGLFSTSCHPVHYRPVEIPTSSGHEHHNSNCCDRISCIVDEDGVPYEIDDDGCAIVPRIEVDVSGLDICDYVRINCPTTVIDNGDNTITISGTNGSGVLIDLNHNPSVVTNNNDGTWTHFDGSGTSVVISTSTLTAVSGGSVFVFHNPGADEYTYIDICAVVSGFCPPPTSTSTPSGLSVVSVSGCLSGDGSSGSPLYINLDPNGYLVCGASGLSVSGLTATSIVNVSGCLAGDGSPGSPINITIDPDGGLTCGPSGLALDDGEGFCQFWSYEDGDCPDSPTEPATIPPSGVVDGTLVIEVWDTCMLFWIYSSGWVLDKTFDGGGGTTNVISGIGPSGCAFVTTIEEEITGAGTHGDPLTGRTLEITQPCSSDVSVDLRQLLYFELGQSSVPVYIDGSGQYQHRFVVPEGFVIDVCRAYITLGVPGTTSTTIEFYANADIGGAAPSVGSADSTLVVPSGVVRARWSDIETSYGSLMHLQEAVTVAGTDAENLTVHIWYKMCPC